MLLLLLPLWLLHLLDTLNDEYQTYKTKNHKKEEKNKTPIIEILTGKQTLVLLWGRGREDIINLRRVSR